MTHIFPQPPNHSALQHRRLESHQPGHASLIAIMRTYDDTFSGEKIYPGKVRRSIITHLQSAPSSRAQPGPHCSLCPVEETTGFDLGSQRVKSGVDTSVRLQGKLYVRGDSKIFRFQNGKTESLFLQRKNPRRIAWTTLYRRQHKKGISEVSKTCFHNCIGQRMRDAGLYTGRRHNDYKH